MNQKNDENQISKLTQATTQRSRELAARGIKRVSKIQHSIEKRLNQALQAGTDTLVEQLTNPKNAEFLQDQLVRVAQFGFTFGFKIDPNAEKLYNFVQWAEQRHGRETVMALVLSQNLLADGRMVQLLTSYASFLGSPAALSGKAPDWKINEIEDFKEQAGNTLLTMLCELAALEHDHPLPDASTEDMIAFFQAPPIPEEFHPLAAMAAGKSPEAIVMPGQKPKSDASAPARPSRLNRLTQAILNNTQKRIGDNDSDSDNTRQTGLARFIPGINDPTFHFIVLSYTFFLETYMLRNLIESLPQILEELAPLTQNDTSPEDFEQNDYTDYTDINGSGSDQ